MKSIISISIRLVVLIMSVLLFTSCATIISGQSTKVHIIINGSNPETQYTLKIRDTDKDILVYNGIVPVIYELPRYGSYIADTKYMLEIYDEREHNVANVELNANKFNGWTIVSGMLSLPLGVLVVDALSGNIYKFGEPAFVEGNGNIRLEGKLSKRNTNQPAKIIIEITETIEDSTSEDE